MSWIGQRNRQISTQSNTSSDQRQQLEDRNWKIPNKLSDILKDGSVDESNTSIVISQRERVPPSHSTWLSPSQRTQIPAIICQ
jgi:hypothetical protein